MMLNKILKLGHILIYTCYSETKKKIAFENQHLGLKVSWMYQNLIEIFVGKNDP